MKHIPYWLISAAIYAVLGGCAARESDERDSGQSAEHERRSRAAQAICREAYGPDALQLWTPEGHLVCRRSVNTPTRPMT